MSKMITYRSKFFYFNWFFKVLLYVEIDSFKVKIDTYQVKIDKCPKNGKKRGIRSAQIDEFIIRLSRLSFFVSTLSQLLLSILANLVFFYIHLLFLFTHTWREKPHKCYLLIIKGHLINLFDPFNTSDDIRTCNTTRYTWKHEQRLVFFFLFVTSQDEKNHFFVLVKELMPIICILEKLVSSYF